MNVITSDILVIGCGISGCVAALQAAENRLSVIMIVKGEEPEESATYDAQGGIVYHGKNDSSQLLMRDILVVGDGASYPPAVKVLAEEGLPLVKEVLIDQAQVPFDRDADGNLDLTEEAAHSVRRIIHVADYTGKAIEVALLKLIKENPNISLVTNRIAIDLLTEEHHTDDPLAVYRRPVCLGAYIFNSKEQVVDSYLANVTILATGGFGSIYLYTTNPQGSTGDGFAMAYRAGAELRNMEYVQFHPTAFRYGDSKCFLISESVRGEGAILKTPDGHPFMNKYHPFRSLAPRDVVSRAVFEEMLEHDYPHVLLDLASYMEEEKIKTRFPTIYETCIERGVDITSEPIPVVPAAHFACGGVKVDLWGRTSIDRLFAVGEVSLTGVHGANRLASTSMLEGLLWGDRSIRKIIEDSHHYLNYKPSPVQEWVYTGVEAPDPALIHQDMNVLRYMMWNYVGLVRSTKRLQRAIEDLKHLQADVEDFYRYAQLTPELIELRNAIQTGVIIAHASWLNKRSRGCHYRIN